MKIAPARKATARSHSVQGSLRKRRIVYVFSLISISEILVWSDSFKKFATSSSDGDRFLRTGPSPFCFIPAAIAPKRIIFPVALFLI